jgi:hypothetical protein
LKCSRQLQAYSGKLQAVASLSRSFPDYFIVLNLPGNHLQLEACGLQLLLYVYVK